MFVGFFEQVYLSLGVLKKISCLLGSGKQCLQLRQGGRVSAKEHINPSRIMHLLVEQIAPCIDIYPQELIEW
jgi:hypothetical protein